MLSNIFRNNSILYRLIFGLFIALVSVPSFAVACNNTATIDSSMIPVVMVNCITDSIPTSVFTTYGQTLLGFLLIINIAFMGVRLAIEGSDINELFGNLLSAFMLYGFASFLMTSSNLDKINTGFDNMASLALATVNGSSSNDTVVQNVMNSMGAAVVLMWTGKPEGTDSNIADSDPSSTKSAITVPSSTTTSGESANTTEQTWIGKVASTASTISNMIPGVALVQWLQTQLIKLIVCLMMLLSAIVFCSVWLYAQVAFKIGICIAPAFVPWLLLKKTEFLFDGWTKFMLSAGVTKLLGGVIVASLFNTVAIANSIANRTSSNLDEFNTWVVLAIMYAVLAYVMGMIPGMARTLTGGSSSSSVPWQSKLSAAGVSSSISNMVSHNKSAASPAKPDTNSPTPQPPANPNANGQSPGGQAGPQAQNMTQAGGAQAGGGGAGSTAGGASSAAGGAVAAGATAGAMVVAQGAQTAMNAATSGAKNSTGGGESSRSTQSTPSKK